MALGTSRAHTCSSAVSCEHMCSCRRVEAQVAFASTAPGNTAQLLFPTLSGNKPTKQGCVKTFTELAKAAGLKRYWENGALGACHLTAAGVDLWRIQIFGR